MRILFITATALEAGALKRHLGNDPLPEALRNIDIDFLITGVGSVATAWEMKQWITANGKPDLAINAGIAGSYRDDIKVGDVVIIDNDRFADAGIDDDGKFITLFEAGFASVDEHPYTNGLLSGDRTYINMFSRFIRPVNAISLNTATGSDDIRMKLVNKFNPDIETMEGATFLYICKRENVPFLAIRSISNMVEKRNKDKWNIPLALDNLSLKLIEIFLILQGKV